jgi:hypothetical protein
LFISSIRYSDRKLTTTPSCHSQLPIPYTAVTELFIRACTYNWYPELQGPEPGKPCLLLSLVHSFFVLQDLAGLSPSSGSTHRGGAILRDSIESYCLLSSLSLLDYTLLKSRECFLLIHLCNLSTALVKVINKLLKPVMVVHTVVSATWEAEAGGSLEHRSSIQGWVTNIVNFFFFSYVAQAGLKLTILLP